MLIIGAKGFAKEVLEIAYQINLTDNLAFFDNVSTDIPDILYDKFPVIKTFEEASNYFTKYGNGFNLGIGNPSSRAALYKRFIELGGIPTSIISPFANIGHYNNKIGECVNIMTGTVITNDVTIGRGSLINLNCTIGHDTIMGEFCELSPGVHVSGNCQIGDYCNIGTGAVILPKVKLGRNVIVGAGAVVTKDVDENTLVVGMPAKEIKKLNPI
ncbi:acetyltransferase [Xanthocytophaga agilis]|uniref:Acetyltransferase n=1 Tax=Xanthocytophaga agilis TaxID=3048010 RepID=A0AAE3R3T7_9BACT|nr:acetyltransferase [Xanthocytophaga agilis]MDJ1502655.1 acetyltransferase [Xanthocytophaga agilis]